ncbi:MAG: hypothetical protein ACT4OO_10210 [Nitrospiraceae bacterium]
MRHILRLVLVSMVCVNVAGLSLAAEKGEKKPGSGKGLASMTQDDKIKLALSAAPMHISRDAGVMLPGEDGKLVEVKKGTNGFTCISTVNNRPEPDPMCFDAAVGQWVDALVNKQEKPGNTVPGISYMARGGFHWEKDGKILMNEEPGAKLVKEPPHWMLMWPFTSQETKLPTLPNSSGAYIMFDGTPFAHLMVYQDPSKMKESEH